MPDDRTRGEGRLPTWAYLQTVTAIILATSLALPADVVCAATQQLSVEELQRQRDQNEITDVLSDRLQRRYGVDALDSWRITRNADGTVTFTSEKTGDTWIGEKRNGQVVLSTNTAPLPGTTPHFVADPFNPTLLYNLSEFRGPTPLRLDLRDPNLLTLNGLVLHATGVGQPAPVLAPAASAGIANDPFAAARNAATNLFGAGGEWHYFVNPDGSAVMAGPKGEVKVFPDGGIKILDFSDPNDRGMTLKSDAAYTIKSPPTSGQLAVNAAVPVVGVPPVDLSKLAVNRAQEQLFGGMTQSLVGPWVDPNSAPVGMTIAQALVFKQWYVLQQLQQARAQGYGWQGLTGDNKLQLINVWQSQAPAILAKYQVYQQWQVKVDDVVGQTTGLAATYNKFAAQAAQLQQQAALLNAQGKTAEAQAAIKEANRLTTNLAASDYGKFLKAREQYYAALSVNPILGIRLDGGAPLFTTFATSASSTVLDKSFDAAVAQFVNQLTTQIDRVSKLDNTKDLFQLTTPMFSGSNTGAAAYGGDYTRGLMNALDATGVGVQAVSDYDKMWWDTAIAIGQAIPVAGLGFTAVQIFREGDDYVVALGNETNANALALGGMGYQGVIDANDQVQGAGQKLFVSVALLPAQIPQLRQALKTGKNLKVWINSGRKANAAGGVATAGAKPSPPPGYAPGRTPSADPAAAQQQLKNFINHQAVTGAAQELEAEIALARQAGMTDADIANITKNFQTGSEASAFNNQVVVTKLMKARLEALGYEIGMIEDEFNRIQQLSVKSYKKPLTPQQIASARQAGATAADIAEAQRLLTPDDVAWLQDRLSKNPWYIDDLTASGYHQDFLKNKWFGNPTPQDGFVAALSGSDDVKALKDAFIKSGGKPPAAWSTPRPTPRLTTGQPGPLPVGNVGGPTQPLNDSGGAAGAALTAGAIGSVIQLPLNNQYSPLPFPLYATPSISGFDIRVANAGGSTSLSPTPAVAALQQAAQAKALDVFGAGVTWTAYTVANGSVVLKSPDGSQFVHAIPSSTGQAPIVETWKRESYGFWAHGKPYPDITHMVISSTTPPPPEVLDAGRVVARAEYRPAAAVPPELTMGGIDPLNPPDLGRRTIDTREETPYGTLRSFMTFNDVPRQPKVQSLSLTVPADITVPPTGLEFDMERDHLFAALGRWLLRPRPLSSSRPAWRAVAPRAETWRASTAALAGSQVTTDSSLGLRAVISSLGTSQGEAFQVQIVNDSSQPLRLSKGTLVVEPLRHASLEQAQKILEKLAPQLKKAVSAKLEGYCLNYSLLPPDAGMLFRIAPPAVQSQYAEAGKVLEVATRLNEAGALKPDSNPKLYVESIKQYAVWSRLEGWDMKKFGDAWLDTTRKQFAAAKRPFTKEFESALRGAVAGRWRDIQAILAAAN